jgi:predicted nucleic acid-binding protein
LIVVDTSVWVDFLRGDDTAAAQRLKGLITEAAPVALTDVILYEVLAGVREPEPLEGWLRAFPLLTLGGADDVSFAAALFRRARDSGNAVSAGPDCLIAAVCIRSDSPLLHSDGDFDRLAACTGLRIFR